jgi:hypothetical protein
MVWQRNRRRARLWVADGRVGGRPQRFMNWLIQLGHPLPVAR